MNQRLSIILAVLLGAASLYGAPAIAQNPIRGQEGRVVILDVSGSMYQRSFVTAPATRWEQALLSLDELMRQLTDRGDRVPTAFMIFGDQGVWRNVRHQYASPRSYPSSGQLCQDVQVLAGFDLASANYSRRVAELASRGTPSGMTPIPLALTRALDLLDPAHGGQIILISDMDAPNCLVQGQTLCSAIENKLAGFRSESGQMRLEFRVLATPAASLSDALADCAPTTTVALPSNNPDHEAAVAGLLGGVRVKVVLRASGTGNLDPDWIDQADLTISAEDPVSGDRAATGPPGDLVVPAGTYRFTASDGTNTWATNATVSSPSEVVIPVDGGTLAITAVDANGDSLLTLTELEILRSDGHAVLTDRDRSIPHSVELGAGRYTVRATAAGYEEVQAEVPVMLSGNSTAVLTFGVRSDLTKVTVTVTLGTPTLDVGTFAPDVVLSGGSLRTATTLTEGPKTLDLAPGLYGVLVALSHRLEFVIPTGATPFQVDLFVPPGRVRAQARQSGGEFVLLNDDNDPLFRFDGPVIEHSLPDGEYQLIYRSATDSTSPPQRFTIVAGERVDLRF